jgi:hypothetical protein
MENDVLATKVAPPSSRSLKLLDIGRKAPRGRCTFRKADVTRAIEAIRNAGGDVQRIEISDGKVILITLPAASSPPSPVALPDTPEKVLGLI